MQNFSSDLQETIEFFEHMKKFYKTNTSVSHEIRIKTFHKSIEPVFCLLADHDSLRYGSALLFQSPTTELSPRTFRDAQHRVNILETMLSLCENEVFVKGIQGEQIRMNVYCDILFGEHYVHGSEDLISFHFQPCHEDYIESLSYTSSFDFFFENYTGFFTDEHQNMYSSKEEVSEEMKSLIRQCYIKGVIEVRDMAKTVNTTQTEQ